MVIQKESLINNLNLFANLQIPDEILRKTFNLEEYTGTWRLKTAREAFAQIKDFKKLIRPVLYRPFDSRFIWYYNARILIDRLRWNVMRHMIAGENLAIVTVRQVAEGIFNHSFITDNLISYRVTLSNKGGAYMYPLTSIPAQIKKTFSQIR